MAQNSYLRAWGRVDSLKNIGQVKTALEEVKSIYEKSKADGLQDQNIKALLYRIILESSFEENSEEKAIAFATEELTNSGTPRKQILYSILAEVYWQYYQNHRWEINDRTILANDTSTDISAWDARRFVETCTRYYTLSVSDDQKLKSISLAQFEGIIQMKKDTRKYRPTLYDFLAFRAIDFFTNESVYPASSSFGSGAGNKELFAPADNFIKTSFYADNQSSFEYQALRLYQEVLRFRLTDSPDIPARIDADLARLAFAYRISTRTDKGPLYIKSLRLLAEQYKDLPVSSDILYQLAFQLKTEGSAFKAGISEDHKWEIKEALELAEKTAGLFPKTDGGKNCRILASGIRQPWLQITGNDAVIPRQPSLALAEYNNINTLYARIIKIAANTSPDEEYRSGQDILKAYLRIKPVQQWSVKMPTDGDYQLHSAEIKIPALLPGQYVLLTSVTPDFKSDSLITFYIFQSSDISLITRWNSNPADILVLNRKDGQPMAGVAVRQYYREYDYNKRKTISQSGGSFTSDENGFVRFKNSQPGWDKSFYLVLNAGDDQMVTENYYQGYRDEQKTGPEIRTWFFTDRAIYRPGQTIYYKGIVIEKLENKAEIKTKFRSTVRFNDVNGQELSKQEVVTNEFGSFTGSFVAPMAGLTGSFSIRDEHGQIEVQVEEYKRPKFETVFNPVKGSFKLGEKVTVTGKAMAYAGNPITEGAVTYRVKRNARFPWIWWGWHNDLPPVAEMEITNGKTTTNGSGEFTVQFNAIPDLSVNKKFSPYFDYSVIADVTDINGETHTAATMVSVGYQALIVTTDLTDEVNGAKGLDFTLQTNNLNGQPENASGLITLHRLEKPAVLLFTRKWKKPDQFTMTQSEFKKSFPEEVYDGEDDISGWSKKEKVLERSFRTPSDSVIRVPSNPGPGFYILEIRTKDTFGEEVVYQKYFQVFLPETGYSTTISPMSVILLKKEAEPGETVAVILSSPLRNVHVVFEFTSINREIKRTSYKLSNQQLRIDLPVLEEHRGNIVIDVTFVKNNRIFQEHRMIRVPYTNKELEISTGSFRDKLEPGQEEEWRITIRDKQGHKTVAELMASMYDASLDAFIRRPWVFSLYGYYTAFSPWNADIGFGTINGTTWWNPHNQDSFIQKEYERIIDFGFSGYAGGRRFMYSLNAVAPEMSMRGVSRPEASEDKAFTVAEEMPEFVGEKSGTTGTRIQPDSQMPPPAKPRTDFKETAFFFPQLITNSNGETIIKFKIPESLTRWRFTGLAHSRDLKTGMLERTLVTQKDLMIFPNPPRFLREGDHMQFSVKISNISESSLHGTTELHFFDALTMKPVDDQMSTQGLLKNFNVGKGESIMVGWDISVPAGLQAVVYRITAATGTFSDGEEAALPVLSNRMLVTESLPLPVRANTTKSFNFKKLSSSAQSNTLQNYRLTLEYTSNPAWYAVQALPYLMEFPHECAEQIFSRYYSNTLASFIANSDPKIRQVFDAWKNKTPDALKSNLEKNEELKAVLLAESPWVREATGENERKQRVGLLFDMNRMADEQKSALKKLTDMQTVNGSWPWFPGMPESEFITQHIITGLGHLYHLKAVNKGKHADLFTLLEKAVGFLDNEKLNGFRKLKKLNPDYQKTNHFDYQMIQYFYARSFFPDVFPFDKSLDEMIAYYKSQAVQYWNGLNNYAKAMTALFLNRMGDKKTALLIMRSLTETALHSDEQGMYWRNNSRGWFWYQAPVETQALLIEAFEEVAGDLKSVDELKVWLLMQKQTQDWKTTKATSEAIYALLLKGSSLLSSGQQVKITVEGTQVNPYLSNITRPEPGTGYFKTSWNTPEITPEKGRITVRNPNNTVAWGAVYWQYFEQLDKITKAETPLKLAKNLFVEVNSPSGPVLEAISNARTIKVGDKIVVRVILSTDRDMEYIHLKDMRASAFEPVNVLSGYRWNGGLGYYESTRDAATNFFIDYLPKGTYVFEYRLHATQKGEFSNGITSVQCMYAPEFAAHSEGIRVKVE